MIELTKEEYQFITSQENLGSGMWGTIYNLENNQIMKLWHQKIINDKEKISDLYYRIKALNKTNVISSTFIFPENIVYYQDVFAGYTAQKIIGETFNGDLLLNYNLEKLLSQINFLYDEITKISNYHIVLNDFKLANMILDSNNSLYIIDTDLYLVMPYENEEDIKRVNQQICSKALLRTLVNTKVIPALRTLNNGDLFKKYNLETLNIIEVLEYTLKNKDNSINTLQDLKTYSLK